MIYTIQILEANGGDVKTIYTSIPTEGKNRASFDARYVHEMHENVGRARITIIQEEDDDTYIRACLIDDGPLIDDIDEATEAFEKWIAKYGAPL